MEFLLGMVVGAGIYWAWNKLGPFIVKGD